MQRLQRLEAELAIEREKRQAAESEMKDLLAKNLEASAA
jgi:hypothetical protein